MFDRFKSWRKQEEKGVECPLCQQRNPEAAESCSRCSYELAKPSHKQDASMDDEAATDLFDQLIDDFEDEDDDDIVDWSNAAFKMDDVTIDVKQYGKDEQVVTKQKPSFAFTVDMPDSSQTEEDEEYELKPGDAPEFVTKFEVPESEEEPEEEPEPQQIELVQPTAEAPEEVIPVPASAISDRNGVETQPEPEHEPEPEPAEETIPEEDPEPGLSDLTVDQLKTLASERGLTGYSKLKKAEIIQLLESEPEPVETEEAEEEAEEKTEIPPPPTDLPPPLIPPSTPTPPEPEGEPEELAIPPPPVIPSIPSMPNPVEPPSYWPWSQQEEWTDRKVAMQVKAAMEAARSKDIAQATVLIDEVGPHLGNRSKLVYPIAALLQRIGRAKAVDKLLEEASQILPEDPNVATARSKLRP